MGGHRSERVDCITVACFPADGLFPSVETCHSCQSCWQPTVGMPCLPELLILCEKCPGVLVHGHPDYLHTCCFTLLIVLVFGEGTDLNFYSLVSLFLYILAPDTYSSIRAPRCSVTAALSVMTGWTLGNCWHWLLQTDFPLFTSSVEALGI